MREPVLLATLVTTRACLNTKLRRYPEAVELWVHAAELWNACEPERGGVDWTEAQIMAGRMALELGDRSEASACFLHVLQSTPECNPDRELAAKLLKSLQSVG